STSMEFPGAPGMPPAPSVCRHGRPAAPASGYSVLALPWPTETARSAFKVGLGATRGALAILHQVAATPSPIIEMLLLTGANLAVTAMRFAAMRWWIFAHRDSREVVPGTEGVPTVVRTR